MAGIVQLPPPWAKNQRTFLFTNPDSSDNPATTGRVETGEVYRVASSGRKSEWSLVRQLRGPHLRTCA